MTLTFKTPGGEGTLCERGERDREDRANYDHGARGQGWREQVWHDGQYHHKITIISPIHDGEATLSTGAELCRSRWSARANPAGWWEGLCGELDHHPDNKTNDDGDDQSSLKFDKLDDKKARLKVKVAQKMN